MDTEKLKTLRNKIDIPLDLAVALLNKNQGDIDACVQEFHHSNIEEICVLTNCGFTLAKENYEIFQFDKLKAIKNINSNPIIISTRENPSSKNEIGFILWPEDDEGNFYNTIKRNDAFIPTADFNIVINVFQSVFPLKNKWNDEVELSFDATGNNYFDKENCKVIIDKIRQIETEDPKIQNFKSELIVYLNDKLTYADYIVVYGNL